MKRRLIGSLVAVVALSSAATEYYVDPSRPNDDGDGRTPATAKQTLQAAAEIASSSGDIIHAAPGDYRSGSKAGYPNDQLNRVLLKAGVTLVSDCGASCTFITGESSDDPNATYGCGANSVRCVYLSSNAKLIGFTLRNGRTGYDAGGNTYFGGGVNANGGTVVADCVFTNCVAVRGGGQNGVACSFRNRYFGCRATSNIGGAGVSGTYFNCIFNGNAASYDLYSCPGVYNCTFGASLGHGPRPALSDYAPVVNCIFLCSPYKGSNAAFKGCCFGAGAPTGACTVDTDTCVTVSASQLKLDADYQPVLGSGCVAVDKGGYDDYRAAYESVKDKDPRSSAFDACGHDRVLGTAIDCGAVECEPKAALSEALARVRTLAGLRSRARVMTASEEVAAEGSGVRMPAGSELELVWERVSTGAVTRAFSVEVVEGATLSVFRGDAESADWTFTAADGRRTVTFAATDDERMRFVCAGEGGSAVLSGFNDGAFVAVSDAGGAMSVTGASAAGGEYFHGEPVEISVSRTYTTKMLCLGFLLNGEFVSFNDHEDGWTWSYAAERSTFADTVGIVAVYATTNDWYVDVLRGNDANDGYRPGPDHALRTLMAAMTNANLSAGDVVHAAKGDYAEGEFGAAPDDQLNRVIVPVGVTLVADDGPDETFITGRAATEPVNDYGCGDDAVRCVVLRERARLVGFTVRGGRTRVGNGDTYKGGGVKGDGAGVVISDCVFTNNVAERGGGAAYIGYSFRNRFFGCRALVNVAAAITDGDGIVCDCICDGNFASYDFYHCSLVCNCTFGRTSAGGPRTTGTDPSQFLDVWNCLYLREPSEGIALHDCVLTTAPRSKNVILDNCVLTNAASIRLDGDYAPLDRDVPTVERGNDAVLADYPAKWDPLGAEFDANHGQRVYNGRVDVGAVEYDWRGDFARTLSRRGLVVTAAGRDVTIDGDALLVPEGSPLALAWTAETDDRYTLGLDVSGTGTAAVLADGTPVAGSPFGAGPATAVIGGGVGDRTADVSFEGEGLVRVSRFRRDRGLILIVR